MKWDGMDYPTGIQQNVLESNILTGYGQTKGFQCIPCYSTTYADKTTVAKMAAACDGELMYILYFWSKYISCI